jgi:hypothetical protein
MTKTEASIRDFEDDNEEFDDYYKYWKNEMLSLQMGLISAYASGNEIVAKQLYYSKLAVFSHILSQSDKDVLDLNISFEAQLMFFFKTLHKKQSYSGEKADYGDYVLIECGYGQLMNYALMFNRIKATLNRLIRERVNEKVVLLYIRGVTPIFAGLYSSKTFKQFSKIEKSDADTQMKTRLYLNTIQSAIHKTRIIPVSYIKYQYISKTAPKSRAEFMEWLS